MTGPGRPADPPALRVLVLGATGTIGRAAVPALVRRGHRVVCAGRADPACPGAEHRRADPTDPVAFARAAIRGERFDAVLCCLASRSGAPADAWAIDRDAAWNGIAAARDAGAARAVVLSALCVQRPHLAFQHAKLALERRVIGSGLDWSIVRPTAFFKSLSGQVARVRDGAPFLLFGDGERTACKPIADEDLAEFLADRLGDPPGRNGIHPIGGPGPAETPRAQGEALFRLLGRAPRFRHVPVGLLDAIVLGLSVAGRASPALAARAELARIGRHYATHSMLALDPVTARPSAAATPSFGARTLAGYWDSVLRGEATIERGEHAVF